MSHFYAILLGVIQGITEFLPISSSGHLVIFQSFIKSFSEIPLLFDLFLHLGTLIAVLVYFRKKIKNYFSDFYKVFYLAVAILATGIIVFPFEKYIESVFSSIRFSSSMLIITGFILFFTKFRKLNYREKFDLKDAFIIGLAQGFAVLPGISRSGTTIAVGIFLGLRANVSFEFSFILSVPTIVIASFFEFKNHSNIFFQGFNYSYILGGTVALVVGLFAINVLSKVIKRKKLQIFSYYCWIVGVSILVLYYFK
jgi:undecaprenyl-diphosphatase